MWASAPEGCISGFFAWKSHFFRSLFLAPVERFFPDVFYFHHWLFGIYF
jgi:hypothetical protein